jgi:hypothetical protein
MIVDGQAPTGRSYTDHPPFYSRQSYVRSPTANEHLAVRFIRGECCKELGNDHVIALREQIHLGALL